MICKICKYEFKNSNDRTYHLKKQHKLKYIEYIIKYYYNNQIPKCKCGCGTILKFKSHKENNWFSEYTKNHWPHKKHTEKIKKIIKENTIKSMQRKYGVDNYWQTEECKNKIKQTKFKKYGDENYNNSNKNKQTCLQKYGVLNPHNIKNVADKIKRTRYNKYIKRLNSEFNTEYLLKFENWYNQLFKFKCKTCNNIWEQKHNIPKCPLCNKKQRSIIQKEIQDYLKTDLNIQTIYSNRKNIITGFELDIYLPDYNVAIEFNGNFWHSELNGKTRKYHIKKTELCEEKNIYLIQIFEDEWINKKEIVKNRLKTILKSNENVIMARKCQIKEIESKEKNIFLENTHLQGKDNSSIKIGLYYQNNLVSVLTFGKQRVALGFKTKNSNENIYEIIRYASNKIIIGGFNKMLHYFIKKYQPTKIISYADRRWVYKHNNIYIKNKFKLINQTAPNYWYMNKNNYLIRYHRYNFRKNILNKKLSYFDKNISEWDNMKNNDYDRIWDCGNFKYELAL